MTFNLTIILSRVAFGFAMIHDLHILASQRQSVEALT